MFTLCWAVGTSGTEVVILLKKNSFSWLNQTKAGQLQANRMERCNLLHRSYAAHGLFLIFGPGIYLSGLIKGGYPSAWAIRDFLCCL